MKYRDPYTVTCIEILHCRCYSEPEVRIDEQHFVIECADLECPCLVASTDFREAVRLWNIKNTNMIGQLKAKAMMEEGNDTAFG